MTDPYADHRARWNAPLPPADRARRGGFPPTDREIRATAVKLAAVSALRGPAKRDWTQAERDALKRAIAAGKGLAACAAAVGRSLEAVRTKCQRLGWRVPR